MTEKYSDVNTGIVSVNNQKITDKHPDIRGRVNVNGLWYWVSGWHRTSAAGNHFTSLAFTEMTQAQVDEMMKRRAEKNAPQQQPQPHAQGQGAPAQAQQAQQAPAQQQAQTQQPPAQGNEPMDFDDDIPF